MMVTLSKAAFARLVGLSRAAITKLCHSGRIPVLPNGKLDANQALAAYKQTQQVGREISAENGRTSGNRKKSAVEAISEDDSQPIVIGGSTSIITQFNKAKTVEKTFQAKLKQLEYEKEKGLLVLKTEVEADAANMAEELRGRLFATAATIITCAGDKVVIPANAMMMIHNPLACVCGYAADLRDKADSLDKVRDSVIAAYRSKTALSPEKLIELMDAETWLNADEAVALGFADDLDSAIRIAASMNNGIVMVNGISFDLSRFINVPAALIENCAIQEISDTTHVKPWAKNEDEIVDLETLKNNQPDLYEKIINEGKVIGQSEERKRIQEIENLAPLGHTELVNKAKFETGVTAATMAIEILNAEKGQSKAYLENRQDDANQLQNTHDNQPASTQHEEQKRIITNAIAAGFTKNR
ncbi:Clp protease ClpP [Yersinia aldovae]|uniref:Clp protease ClpP n=1 Tax=Yersinia aldovae TaxID=29483 RepID=UPI0009E2448F|nr:Clp protease ClpP [Yersinia aldovae]